MEQHESESSEAEMMANRIRLRKYFQELNHFSKVLV